DGGWPQVLPGGRRFVYSTRNGIYAASLDAADSEPRRLFDGSWTPLAYSDGHLLFVRNRALVALRCDARAGEVSGEPITVAHNLL
ncbi:hypothetical protein, partial [Salmonella sp. SAL4443]|uniref:hypothetical protein n=1 Tax=Salmonella sp. SAL4443 TaxID=3159898 RepID=UPI00397910FB